jgi:peptidoglycan/LPS O-acetylase OafA/YrhL
MYKSLQAGRGVAALLVVLFHLGTAFAADKYFGAKSLGRAFQFGDTGVEFFFVLSGFIVTWVHFADLHRRDRVLPYLRKRAVRIYPVYWMVFLSVYLIALASPSLRSTVPHDPLVIAKSLALLPQDPSIAGATGAPVLIVAWSLQYEVLFYAVIAAFIAHRAYGILVSGLLLLNLAACQYAVCSFPRSFYASDLLVLFGLGALVALACKRSLKIRRPTTLAVIGLCAFFATGILEVVKNSQDYIVDRRLIYGLFSAAIILGLVRAEDAGKLAKVPPWLLSLGNASFSLYLIHYPLISILCKTMLAVGLTGTVGAAVSFPIILCSCIVASLAFHGYVEKPCLRALAGRPRIRRDPLGFGREMP